MIARFGRELSILGALAVVLAVLAAAAPAFFAGENVRSVAVSAAPALVAALGMTLVIIAGHIDVSIGSQFCVGAVVAGLLAEAGVPMPVVVAATLLAGGAMGAVNGLLVAFARLPSIVATLATMVILREGLRWQRQGEFVRNLPDGFQWFGRSQGAGQWTVVGAAVAVLVLVALGLRWLHAGRAVYATGSDPEAARLAGIRPRGVVVGVFVVMGVLTAGAAILGAVRFADVDPNAGAGLEMKSIAAAVVGGAAVSGGRGTPAGTFAGVLLLGVIGPGLVFLGVPPQWERVVQGLIILGAVSADAWHGKPAR